eukprot:GHRQ01002523.1.p1 GENE.GHRQ01002523.1~~GHRQ01002523.1.p1  ORF type:complete len:242 (+),score=80.43 GHRQ01002523.1:222-947(+)
MPEFRVRFSDEQELQVEIAASATFKDVALKVCAAKGWGNQQHVRFICSGQEMYMQDSVSRACCSVLHCIATDTASRYSCAKQAGYKSGAQAQAVDWLEVVDPGTVLIWIFGSILALLWLLFVLNAHMFDKTSVAMLCMMTVAFLMPCALSYAPGLHMPRFSQSLPPSRQQQQQQYHNGSTPRSGGLQYAGAPAMHSSSGYGYGLQSANANQAAVPPRPSARVRGPGTAVHHSTPAADSGSG